MLLLSAIWGASFILIKLSGDVFPPAWVALLRLCFGAAVLWAALLWTKRPLPPRRMLLPLIAIATLNNAIPFSFIAWGERSIPSNMAAVLNATTTLWGLLFGLLFRHDGSLHKDQNDKDQSDWRIGTGVLVGFAGVALVVSSGHEKGEIHWPGIALVALASVSYAIATAMAKTHLKGFDPLGLATTQLTLAILLMLPVAAIGPRPSGITLQSVLAVGALGVFGTGIAYLLYYGMLARISAIQVQAVTYVLPVWGLFWGALAGEAVGVLSIAGVAIVLAGLMLLRAPGRPVSSEKLREPAA
jgi:drug/metabolite transporter (DMT)-like permease